METGKKCLLILVIIGFVALCRCGPTCPLVGLEVNEQYLGEAPNLGKYTGCFGGWTKYYILYLNAKKDGNGDIKFSYWPKFCTRGKKLDQIPRGKKLYQIPRGEELYQIQIQKSEVTDDDLPNEITLKDIYEQPPETSEGSSIKGKSSGTDRDTSDIKHKKRRSSSGSSSGRGSQSSIESPKTFKGLNYKFKNLFRCGSGTDRDTSDIKHKTSSRSRKSSIEPNNCENVKITFVKAGVQTLVKDGCNTVGGIRSETVFVYGKRIDNYIHSYSIGYSRENQEPIFYPLPLIAKGWQEYILLTLDEAGKIIQDGVALSPSVIDSANLIIKGWITIPKFKIPKLYLKRKNQHQEFPEELCFEITDKDLSFQSTGNKFVDKIRYKYDDVAGEHDPVHKLDLPGNQQIAKYIVKEVYKKV